MSPSGRARWRAHGERCQNLLRLLWWLLRVGLTGAALTPPRPQARHRWREEARLLREVDRGSAEIAAYLSATAHR